MTNGLNEDKFDRMLAGALQRHSEPTPADFTEKVLVAIKQAEQQRILAGVVLQERIALAASIVSGVAAVVVVIFFPSAIAGFFNSFASGLLEQIAMLANGIPKIVETISRQWQSYAILTAVFGLAICALVDLLVGDRLRIA